MWVKNGLTITCHALVFALEQVAATVLAVIPGFVLGRF